MGSAPILVSWARGSPGYASEVAHAETVSQDPNAAGYKLFVGILPPDCTKEELKIIFGTYGKVLDVHLMSCSKSVSGQASAFVIYENMAAGDAAIAALDGVRSIRQDGSPPVCASWARSSGFSAVSRGAYRQAQAPALPSQPRITPPAPPSIAGYSGHVTGMANPGFGGSLVQPVAATHSYIPTQYDYGWQVPPPPATISTSQRTKLFVGNLPQDITHILTKIFSHYGVVTNVHLMSGKARSGQACAFV